MIADHRAISAFLDAKAAESGSALNTVLAYGRDLRDLSDWLSTHKLALAQLTRERVEDYLAHCDAQGLSRATRARRLSSIRQLFRFAHEEGFRPDNPALRLSGPGRGPCPLPTCAPCTANKSLRPRAGSGNGPAPCARWRLPWRAVIPCPPCPSLLTNFARPTWPICWPR